MPVRIFCISIVNRGDYVGGGQEILYTDADVDFSVNAYSNGGLLNIRMNNFQRPNAPQSIWWYLDIETPYRAPMAIGTYEGAARYPFNDDSQPGLSFYGSGRGCNQVHGRFEVKEVQLDSDGNIISLALDFFQSCYAGGPGSIWFP